jgi:hypothetical protein
MMTHQVLSRAINFGHQCHFKVWLDCHKFKKFPCLIMPTSTKCQKIEKKMTINVIQYDDRLWYLRLFYNGAFSIASKNDLDDQNLLLASVPSMLLYFLIDYSSFEDSASVRKLKFLKGDPNGTSKLAPRLPLVLNPFDICQNVDKVVPAPRLPPNQYQIAATLSPSGKIESNWKAFSENQPRIVTESKRKFAQK